jgi:hypothetical protein
VAPTNGNAVYFWTPKEAADFLRIDTNTLYRMLKKPERKGGPPRIRVGVGSHFLRIPREKFITWITERDTTNV